MINLTLSPAREWAAGRHIRVNAVAPGPVMTPLMARGLNAALHTRRALLTGRLIEAEGFTPHSLLLSDHARSITGAVLNQSGGWCSTSHRRRPMRAVA